MSKSKTGISNKQQKKIWFTDFYKGFDPLDNYLYHLLKRHYELVLDPENPDYLIYSCYSRNFLKYQNSLRIYYTGENLVPDFNLCDYAIGFHYVDFEHRYLRFPNFAMLRDQVEKLTLPKNHTLTNLKNKEYFCNFIYANSQADPARDDFFDILGTYKSISSPGKHRNNSTMDVGERFENDWMYTKLSFQSKCKFTIAFENSSSPGYTTEKLMHAYISNSIPIYWGNPEATKDFNPQSFINCHDFGSFEEVVKKVQEIDENDELALKILNEPPFRNNITPFNLREETLEKFLLSIFDQDPKMAFRRPQFGTTQNYEKESYSRYFKAEETGYSALKRLLKFIVNTPQTKTK
ncbi:glycosyltransferase family 10 domain-containing protein [Salinimicrobium sp. WS361]|uniref:glycosyltransferase family 10 domain-containing protein n=1 Tax=Salinimicrobium sp. WS361 TaxID=3425123 RepID=UPI003D6EA76C